MALIKKRFKLCKCGRYVRKLYMQAMGTKPLQPGIYVCIWCKRLYVPSSYLLEGEYVEIAT